MDPLNLHDQEDVPQPSQSQVLRAPRNRPTPPGSATRLPEGWLPAVVSFGIPFFLLFTLAIEAGGYGLVLRSQVGIVVWWTVLLGLAAGLLPASRVTRSGRIAMIAFGALIAMTALGALTWTETAERSAIELSRTVTIFGTFLLMLMIQGRESLRGAVSAVGACTALVAVIALGDRFDPGLLPFGTSEMLPAEYPQARLNWPIEYWNGLAALMAVGIGSLVWAASSAGASWWRAIAAGSIPLVVLATYMTASRGGSAAAILGLVTLVLLFPQRLRLLVGSLIPAAGSLVLILMVNARTEVRDLVPGAVASDQGTEMIWICLAVFVLVAGLQVLVTGLIERGSLRPPAISRKTTSIFGSAVGATVAVLLIFLVASGFISDRWSEFKQPPDQGTVGRLANVNSGERYSVWKAAVEAADSEKLTGIGPGAFEYWWAREDNGQQFVRDAHSIYLEFLAEMGPLAFLLILILIFGPIAYAVILSTRNRSIEQRAALAAATAGMVAFAVAAGVDWAWEITVLPVAFFVLAAAVLGPDIEPSASGVRDTPRDELDNRTDSARAPLIRVAGAVGALLAVVVIAVPMAGQQAFESSQQFVREGDLEGALEKAERSTDLQPWAASSKIQRAQILELLGRQQEAIGLAREATDLEQGNWRNWLVFSQLLEDESPDRALQALERARALNPKSTLPQLAIPGSAEGP